MMIGILFKWSSLTEKHGTDGREFHKPGAQEKRLLA